MTQGAGALDRAHQQQAGVRRATRSRGLLVGLVVLVSTTLGFASVASAGHKQRSTDRTAPETSIVSGPADGSTLTDGSFSFSFVGTDNVGVKGFECSLDGAAFAGCSSPKDFSGLPDGAHTFRVRAYDAAGNRDGSPASRSLTVESQPVAPSDPVEPTGLAVGVASDALWGISATDIDRTVELERQLGAKVAREAIPWSAVEPEKGVYSASQLSTIDSVVSKNHAAGMRTIGYIDQVPYWASSDPDKHIDSSGRPVWNKHYAPTDAADYAKFIGFLAARYKGTPLNTFEIWNEPNLTRFWPSGPDPGQYTHLLKGAYAAGKAANPDAVILSAGLSPNAGAYEFYRGMYAAGAKGSFDRLGVHQYPYLDPAKCWNDATGVPATDTICSLSEIRRIQSEHGDESPMMVTEMGWSTGSCSWCATETTQGQWLTTALSRIKSEHPYVEAVAIYHFRNLYWTRLGDTGEPSNYGLVRQDYSLKPAYTAVQAWIAQNP